MSLAERHDTQYRAVLDQAGIVARDDHGLLVAHGTDRAGYLQGLLSNDVEALAAGDGCYATYLTPQGRMITDLAVYELGDRMLLDLPGHASSAVAERLGAFVFAEDVRVEDVSGDRVTLGVHGPSAARILSEATGGDRDQLEALDEYRHVTIGVEEGPLIVAASRQLGVRGFVLFGPGRAVAAVATACRERGAVDVDVDVADVLRIEAGRPKFGSDMDEQTIPLEAGIEDRAISLTKGCYVGQEVIIRVLHRGHGRVARRLVGLTLEAEAAAPGDALVADEGDVGRLTSVGRSPRFGVIGLGYVQRRLADAGTRLELRHAGTTVAATVTQTPFGGSPGPGSPSSDQTTPS